MDTKYWNRDSEIPRSNVPPPPSYEQFSQDFAGKFSYSDREHKRKNSPETGISISVVEEDSPPSDQNERKTSFWSEYRRIQWGLFVFALIIFLIRYFFNEELQPSSNKTSYNYYSDKEEIKPAAKSDSVEEKWW